VAIYRPPRRKWRGAAAIGLVALIAGLSAGWFLGSRGSDLDAAADEIGRTMLAAAGGLEVLSVEYRQSVSGGRVVAPTEFGGARGALVESRSTYDEVAGPLGRVDPSLADAIDSAYDRVRELVDRRAEPNEVDAAAAELEALLKGRSEGQ
jgi:hypothetical protein